MATVTEEERHLSGSEPGSPGGAASAAGGGVFGDGMGRFSVEQRVALVVTDERIHIYRPIAHPAKREDDGTPTSAESRAGSEGGEGGQPQQAASEWEQWITPLPHGNLSQLVLGHRMLYIVLRFTVLSMRQCVGFLSLGTPHLRMRAHCQLLCALTPTLFLSLSLSLSANAHTHTPTPHTDNISFDDAEPDELTTEYISLVVLTRSNHISERILSALQSAFPTSVRITTDDDLVLSAIEQRIIEHQVCSPCLEL